MALSLGNASRENLLAWIATLAGELKSTGLIAKLSADTRREFAAIEKTQGALAKAMLEGGKDSYEVARATGLPIGSVIAHKAHLPGKRAKGRAGA